MREMEKSRLFVVLIFVTAIPIIVSKNAKVGAISGIANGMIAETNRELRLGVTDCFRRALKSLSFLIKDLTQDEFDNFVKHFRAFDAVAVVNKEYNSELAAGAKLKLGGYEWGFIKKALESGRPSIFLRVSESSRIYLNMIVPFKDVSGEWKCLYATGDFTDLLASYTHPVDHPMAVYRYVYDSPNRIILPSFSNMNLGIKLIRYFVRNLPYGFVGESEYIVYRTKIEMVKEKIDITGLHAISVIPKSFMNHIMIEYRIKTNAILIIIFIVLAIMFVDIYRGYSKMENTVKMYKGIIEDAGVAIVLFDINNMRVLNSNKMARNAFYIEQGMELKHFFSKESDREYINKVLFTIGSLYNYKLGIRAKYNEELTVILSLGVNIDRKEGTLTFFEENAFASKNAALAVTQGNKQAGEKAAEISEAERPEPGAPNSFEDEEAVLSKGQREGNDDEDEEEDEDELGGILKPKEELEEAGKEEFLANEMAQIMGEMGPKRQEKTDDEEEEEEEEEEKSDDDGEEDRPKAPKTGWEEIEGDFGPKKR